MKKSILIVCAAVVTLMVTSCDDKAVDKVKAENVDAAAQRDANANKFAEMKFEEKIHDFGHIKHGEKQEYAFKFTNTGEVPLVVTSVKASCGCTVPQKPEAPVKPGEQGEIKVSYNGNGTNNITKDVTITANTKAGTEKISIKAFVEPKPINAPK